MRRKALLTGLTVVGLLLSGSARATVYEVHSGEDLFGVLGTLVAGDEVIVYDGTYDRPGFVELHLDGTAAQPIVIRAAAGNHPVITASTDQNIINFFGQHFTFKGFECTGGSRGLRLQDVHDALFEDLHIHGTQGVGFAANDSGMDYYNLTIRRVEVNHTAGTGEGMYLGCFDGSCTFRDSLVESNYVHHTNQGTSQGDGIEIKPNCWNNVVRYNVIHDASYPCIIVYGAAGNGPNVIENNVMWSCSESGIQAAADAIIRNNIILDVGIGINSHTHSGASPQNLTIVHNTIITCADRCLRSSDWLGSTGIVVANNVFYNAGGNAVRIADGDADISFHHNLVLGATEGVSGGTLPGNSAAADFVDVANLDVWPTAGSAVIDAGDPAVGVTVDFNGSPRDSAPDIGAYEWAAGGNPGWDVGPGFMDTDGGVPAPDASTPQPDASTPGPDSSLPGPDSGGSTDDAGTDPSGAKDGCGCRTTPAGGAPLGLLIVVALLWVRRRSA